MAVLSHVLQLIGGWIAPLVIFLVKRQSRFITFHALQVLLFQGVCLFLTMFAMAGFFMAIGLGISLGHWNARSGPSTAPPLLFLFFGVFWLGFVVLGVVKLVFAIVYAVKAGRGEWAEYPILGRFARHILNMGPGGAVINP